MRGSQETIAEDFSEHSFYEDFNNLFGIPTSSPLISKDNPRLEQENYKAHGSEERNSVNSEVCPENSHSIPSYFESVGITLSPFKKIL